MNKLYATRSIQEISPFFMQHVSAMRDEGLLREVDIAAELAYRDMLIFLLVGWSENAQPYLPKEAKGDLAHFKQTFLNDSGTQE